MMKAAGSSERKRSRVFAETKSSETNDENEAMAIIFWDKAEKHFFAYVPKQTVTKEQIDADLTECPYPRSRFHRDDAEVSAQERGN